MATYLFDFDGTLADSFSVMCNILIKEAEYLGCKPLHASEIDRLRNMHAREILKYLNVPLWRTPGFVKKLRKLGNREIDKTIIFPEWLAVLKTLKANKHTLGIISSNSQETIKPLLIQYKLHALFDFIICGKSLFSKSRCLNKVIKSLGLNRNDTYYMGDEVRDIEAAQKSKIHSIAVTWGFNSEARLKLAKPELLITQRSELKLIFGARHSPHDASAPS